MGVRGIRMREDRSTGGRACKLCDDQVPGYVKTRTGRTDVERAGDHAKVHGDPVQHPSLPLGRALVEIWCLRQRRIHDVQQEVRRYVRDTSLAVRAGGEGGRTMSGGRVGWWGCWRSLLHVDDHTGSVIECRGEGEVR